MVIIHSSLTWINIALLAFLIIPARCRLDASLFRAHYRGNGLDLLAAATFSSSKKHVEEGCAAEPMYAGSLSKPGRLNPAASVALNVAKKILNLDLGVHHHQVAT